MLCDERGRVGTLRELWLAEVTVQGLALWWLFEVCSALGVNPNPLCGQFGRDIMALLRLGCTVKASSTMLAVSCPLPAGALFAPGKRVTLVFEFHEKYPFQPIPFALVEPAGISDKASWLSVFVVLSFIFCRRSCFVAVRSCWMPMPSGVQRKHLSTLSKRSLQCLWAVVALGAPDSTIFTSEHLLTHVTLHGPSAVMQGCGCLYSMLVGFFLYMSCRFIVAALYFPICCFILSMFSCFSMCLQSNSSQLSCPICFFLFMFFI